MAVKSTGPDDIRSRDHQLGGAPPPARGATIAAMKDEARRLRKALGDDGHGLSHGAALEAVAKLHGYRDWNTAAALAGSRADDAGRLALPQAGAQQQPVGARPRFGVGDSVQGRYLGQAFSGMVLSLSALPGGMLFKVTLHFDEAVDVVAFESFSALRRRVNGTVDASGVSPRRTSNGLPQLVIDR